MHSDRKHLFVAAAVVVVVVWFGVGGGQIEALVHRCDRLVVCVKKVEIILRHLIINTYPPP